MINKTFEIISRNHPDQDSFTKSKSVNEIAIHMMEFVIWFKEDENFLKCYINNEVRYLDRNRYDKWTTTPQLECYFTIKEVYEYWATNVSK